MILQIFKILHGICTNDLNIQFAPPSRLGVKAIIPNLNRAASQRHQTLYDISHLLFCALVFGIPFPQSLLKLVSGSSLKIA